MPTRHRFAAVLAAVTTAKGTVTRGQQLATQLGCAVCHTFSSSEPLKGPFLGAIANIQRRRDIAERDARRDMEREMADVRTGRR